MKIKILYLLFISISILNLNGQEKIFYSADRFEGTQTNDGPVKEYFGNVKIIQGDVTITCDYAKYLEYSNFSYLKGNVKLVQNDLVLKSEEATYDGNKKFTQTDKELTIDDKNSFLKAKSGDYNAETNIANFYKNVYIEDDSTIINSNYLKYDKKTRYTYSTGNILIKGKYSNTYLLSDTLEHFPNKNYTIATGSPKLFQVDSTFENGVVNHDTLTVKSDTMEAIRSSSKEIYYFRKNFEMVKGEISAKSDLGIYDKQNDVFNLKKDPVLWYDNTQLYGDSIRVELTENKLKLIKSSGTAFSITKEFPEYAEYLNQLSGQTITLHFKNGEIQSLFCVENAQSLYFSKNEKDVIDAHRHDCKKIEIFFKDDEIDTINFLENVEAEAIPYDDYYQDVDKYYLPRYKWSVDKPSKLNIEYKSNYYSL